MYQKILMPLDGSERAECVLDIAGAIASRAGAQVDLIHIGAAAQVAAMRRDVYLEHVAQRMSERWTIKVTSATIDDERFEPHVKVEIAAALFQHACDSGVDLVVLTRLGRGGLVRAWLSSVSRHMIRWCPMPVLVWRAEGGMPSPGTISALQRVVVPLDGSRVSEEILGHAATMKHLLGTRLELLRVVTPGQMRGSPLTLEVARTYLDELLVGLRSQGVLASGSVVQAESAARAILEFAGVGREPEAIVAMSTHGRTGIARVLLGSVAEAVLDNATMPLLLYRPGDLSES